MADLKAEDYARAWRRASRRWLGKPIMCAGWRRWWHRWQRKRDRLLVVDGRIVGVWRDDFNGNGPGYYDLANFPYWFCGCADEDMAIRKDV